MVYWWVLAITIFERLAELIISRRNAKWSLVQGGVEFGRDHYKWMVILHSTYLVACVLEPLLLERVVSTEWAVFFTVIVVLTQGLRWWVITTLGRQWNTRVIIVPGLTRIQGGPFRFFNHPNYIAVIIELAALPLIHGAWTTSVIFSILNLWLLRVRIRIENEALKSLSI
jgi:methyltransferase